MTDFDDSAEAARDDAGRTQALRANFPFGFALSGAEWERARAGELLTSPGPPGPSEVRLLAHRINARRLALIPPGTAVEAGQLILLGALVEAQRYVFENYCHAGHRDVLARGLAWTGQHLGREVVEGPPPVFTRLFPPFPVLARSLSGEEFLAGRSLVSAGRTAPNLEITAAEMVLLELLSENPAARPFRDLFDDAELTAACPYPALVRGLEDFFDHEPPMAELRQGLFRVLRAPMLASPDSLEGQLEYIAGHWKRLLPRRLLDLITQARDLAREEAVMRGQGPGPVPVLSFGHDDAGPESMYSEPAAFSRDADWMSNVVILAKSTHVWLDQLAKQYQRPIRILSDVPDQELDRLARWGFTGLWLIGLWERSCASEKIKKIMGNPEAAASAYSLYDYTIAADLGGEAAYQDLRERARSRGIRLASDMVPNHTGIYSRWVVERPDWFVQLDQPPYPWYVFSGADLSDDPRVCVQLEDGYWERRDAAVVFRRFDRETGEARYIYHGNDGTSMPWNDTAQLNFMLAEVREAVIQTVLHVARKFSIIRFDAAMTLAKRHFQRLWFPKPGEGGAIPTRAERGMTAAEFDRAMPAEFWREVVDRVAAEVPDTLLLAEAFWLMEGYFVRTLGMHRVYNSAFMNMLKMEDNAKYRTTVKNVLEFSPEVIKRFVNFMNNPDEETAVAQFGGGDKYIGVCVLMVTMPGLPMFGHGQVEGLTEKYGMEYRRAYWDERADEDLVRRHEAEVFPLMRRRALFSGSENFALYDFVTADGAVDENVFAYTNRAGAERALVFFNNAFNSTRGRVQTSTPINVGPSEAPDLVRRTLGQALALNTDQNVYYAFREHRSGREHLRLGRGLAESGLDIELGGYQHRVYLDFRELHDHDGSWARLAARIGPDGVPSLDHAYRRMMLDPVLDPLARVFDPGHLRALAAGDVAILDGIEGPLRDFLAEAAARAGFCGDLDAVRASVMTDIARIAVLDQAPAGQDVASLKPALLAARVALALGGLFRGQARTEARARLDDWLVGDVVTEALTLFGGSLVYAEADLILVRIMLGHSGLLEPGLDPADDSAEPGTVAKKLQAALDDPLVMRYLRGNRHQDRIYLNQEQLERLLAGLVLAAALGVPERILAGPGPGPEPGPDTGKNSDQDQQAVPAPDFAPFAAVAGLVLAAAQAANYEIGETLDILGRKTIA